MASESSWRLESEPREPFSKEEYAVYQAEYQQRSKIFLLVERFYHQIRYGCTNPDCKTTACHSYRSHIKKGSPYRVPTQVTARALACFLASLDHPYEQLCINPPAPRSKPFDIAFPAARRLHFLIGSNREGLDDRIAALKKDEKLSEIADFQAKAEFEEWLNNQALSGTPVDLKAAYPYISDPQFDIKSFIQRFFSSHSWKLAPIWESSRLGDHAKFAAASLRLAEDDLHFDARIIHQRFERRPVVLAGSFLLDAVVDDEIIYKEYDGPEVARVPGLPIEFETSELAAILSNPSRLMFYGRVTFKIDIRRSRESDLTNKIPPLISDVPGLSNYLSQPMEVLTREFAVLHQSHHVDPTSMYVWLAPSIKAIYNDRNAEYDIPDSVAAHICTIGLALLLTETVTKYEDPVEYAKRRPFHEARKHGHVLPPGPKARERVNAEPFALVYEDPAAQYLMRLIMRAFASWSYADKSPQPPSEDNEDMKRDLSEFKTRLELSFRRAVKPSEYSLWRTSRAVLEWAQTIFLRDWDGEARFRWDTDVGAAVEFMSWLFEIRNPLALQDADFDIVILQQRLDFVEACKAWMDLKTTTTEGHLFDYPWLFSHRAKITYFRSANMSRMMAAFETATIANRMAVKMMPHHNEAANQLLQRLEAARNQNLVLEIRRDNILADAFNELWRRQKRELIRPLKVRMGMDEGEEGVDMGGVQQEFFRLAISEALDPAHGLFTVDETTRMTWFQPLSTAPLYQYTIIGLLFGLAVYNGITLTVTFPEVFYAKLLAVDRGELQIDERSPLNYIQDGWPELHRGLESLLTWSNGTVEDVFVRNYAFSFDANGIKHDVDMQATPRDGPWPSESDKLDSKDAEPAMVTNDNRQQYVQDYVFWLLNKSIRLQFEAFASGFYMPLHKKTLRLFAAPDLKVYLEGHQEIDIQGLKATAKYEDGFSKHHEKIKELWEIVENLSPEQHKKLLEFVTASPRVPVRGMSDLTFIIQRNGVGDERLPTSMTCFGRLLLPQYSTKEIMAEKLQLAIENSTGFGTQ